MHLMQGFDYHRAAVSYSILKLNEADFVVCANDHVGHGKTAYDSGHMDGLR